MKNDAGITVGYLPQNIMCYKNNMDFNVPIEPNAILKSLQ